MGKYIVITLLVLFFIYMIVWTFRLRVHTKRQDKMKRIQELRDKNSERKQSAQETEETADKAQSETEQPVSTQAVEKETKKVSKKKQEEPKKSVVDETRDYWINRIELKDAENGKEEEKCYHYIDNIEQGVHDLLIEMYDYGLVRVDELEEIAYGESRLDKVDLSFLKEFGEDTKSEEKNPVDEDVIQVEGMDAVLDAAKKLEENDPGITDIHGTLSHGMEKVIQAVDKEKELETKKKEPILVKEKKSVEKDRENRKKTSSQEIRNQIFMKWDHYVASLYEMIEVHADEDTKRKIKKSLRDYGYNDVDVLLKSPE